MGAINRTRSRNAISIVCTQPIIRLPQISSKRPQLGVLGKSVPLFVSKLIEKGIRLEITQNYNSRVAQEVILMSILCIQFPLQPDNDVTDSKVLRRSQRVHYWWIGVRRETARREAVEIVPGDRQYLFIDEGQERGQRPTKTQPDIRITGQFELGDSIKMINSNE